MVEFPKFNLFQDRNIINPRNNNVGAYVVVEYLNICVIKINFFLINNLLSIRKNIINNVQFIIKKIELDCFWIISIKSPYLEFMILDSTFTIKFPYRCLMCSDLI